MALINLEQLDTAMLKQTNFGPDMNRWLTNVVDIINASFNTLSNYVNNLITVSGYDITGGGASPGPFTIPVVGLTPSGYVNVTLISTTNPNITIASVVPGTNSFNITFSADPGASAIIVYQAFISQPQ